MRRIITLALLYLSSLAMMALQKPLFLAWYASRAADCSTSELWGVVGSGLLLDSTVAGYICALPWLLLLVAVWVAIPERVIRRLLNGYLALMAVLCALLVAVDMGLFRHWDFRLDSTILPYLHTPKEAMASIEWSDVWPTTLLFVAYATLLFVVWRAVAKSFRATKESLAQKGISTAVMLLAGGLIFLAIRGGTDTAPANVSKVYFSDNMFLNQAATNPIFSFLSSAARSELKDSDYNYFPEEEIGKEFRQAMTTTSAQTATAENLQTATAATAANPAPYENHLRTRRPNVVLVMMESMGRTVMDEIIDGRAVAPNLQRIKGEGIWFENMFANSYRTDRGTVAIMSGYPAHPVVSVMKYPKKAHTLPAIARSLQHEGYSTHFVYGGDANFTNTISYLYGTGVEHIKDKAQLAFDAPTNEWGYADDVMCEFFTEQVEQLARQSDQPFFATLLTQSSHEPFDVEYDAFENKILNSVAFADEHIGRMIDSWRNSSVWDDMLVILIADHGMPYPEGLTTGSLERQRIPMIWTGGAVEGGGATIETFCSQSDLYATLLAQMGIDADENIFSKDIFSHEVPHYAFWSYNNAFGVIDTEGWMVYDATLENVIEQKGDAPTIERLERRGKAIVQTLHQDIRNR